MIRLPRLMDASLQHLGTVTPLSLSIEMNLTPPSTAVMTLPADAPAIQPGQFMELFTAHGSAGIFRVEQTEHSYPSPSRITLVHALATLSDSILQPSEETTQPAADFFRTILNRQSLWQAGDVSVPADTLITWRSESSSLLEALMALMQALPGHHLTFDQTAAPWKLNLLPLPDVCATECRLTRNLRSMTIETDRSELCTQLYLPGIAEPLRADTITRWGTVSRILAADAGLTPEELTVCGQQYLEQHKDPQITVTLDALELSAATGSALDNFHLGKLCRVCLPEENTALVHRIVTLTCPDVYGAPESLRVSLSTCTRNTSTVLAGLIVDATKVKRQVVQQWNTLQEQKELLISAEESITLISKDITLHAKELLTLRSGVDDNAASITLLDGRITANAREISLHANDILTLSSGVDDNTAAITLANGRIEANANAISLQANNVLTLEAGVSENKAAIALANGYIALLADDISANANAIALKADQASLDLANGRIEANAKEISANADSIAANAKSITANANAIALKADQASLDLANGRIDAQANEITLKANKIDLQGYVTANELAAESAKINEFFSGSAVAAKMIVTNLTAISFTFAGNACTWTSTELVTDVSVNATGEIAVRDADGNIIGTAVTGVRRTQSKEQIYYLTWTA